MLTPHTPLRHLLRIKVRSVILESIMYQFFLLIPLLGLYFRFLAISLLCLVRFWVLYIKKEPYNIIYCYLAQDMSSILLVISNIVLAVICTIICFGVPLF